MRRRSLLRAAEVGGVSALLAGRTGIGGEQTATEVLGDATETIATTEGTTTGGESRTLTVGAYGPFVDVPGSSPGPWLKETFKLEFNATLGWQTPDSGVSYCIERDLRDVESDADLYVDPDAQMLVRIDRELDEALFSPAGGLSRINDVKEGLNFNPQGRMVPYNTNCIPFVYDETYGDGDFVAPETFDGLPDPEYAGTLLAQNPTSSATGQASLLHTIDAKGEGSYLDYWASLKENDARVLGSWEDTYNAYLNGRTPMAISYSTDQASAAESGEDMARHRIRFLNDQAYTSPEGIAPLADVSSPDLAVEFMDFILRPEVQTEIVVRNVQFPVMTTVELPEGFARCAQEPLEAVAFPYNRFQSNLSDWTDTWAREFISR